MATFSDRLRMLRLEREEKQADIAKMLGVSVQSYSAYESGREPKFDILAEIARHFGVTIDYLAGFSDLRTAENASISASTGLSDEAIARIKQLREFGVTDILNSILFHIDFTAALGSLKNMIERGYSPQKYYIVIDKDDAGAFANDESCGARILIGNELNRPFVVTAQERMGNVISDVAKSLESTSRKD